MIRKDYESFVLSVGEYDERIFLDEDATEEIGTPAKCIVNESEIGEKPSRNLSMQFEGHSNLIPTTPLSGKHYLRAKEQLKVTPVSTATYLVSRLTTLLGRRNPEPSPKLEELLQSCSPNPTEAIMARIKNLGKNKIIPFPI